MKIIFIILCFFTRPIFSAENDLLNEIYQLNQKKINKIISNKKKKNKFKKSQIIALEIILKDIMASPVEYVHIRRGAKLVTLENDKVVYNPKGINAYVHQLSDKDQFKYVLDKKKVLRYRVHFKHLTKLDEITDLKSKPKNFLELTEKPFVVKSYDNDFAIALKFNLHAGMQSSKLASKILDANEKNALLTRLELSTLSNLKSSFELGMNLAYETSTGSLGSANFASRSLSTGPIFIRKNLISDFDFSLGARISLFSDLKEVKSSNEEAQYKLNETFLFLGLEKFIDKENLGEFSYGINVQRKWTKANANNESLNINSDNIFEDSLTFSIGHKSDWL